MVRKWAHGLILGLLLGSIFAAFPEAQNYVWSSINGIPYAPAIGLVRGTPSVTTDVLYNSGGTLYFNGSAVGTSWPLTAPAGGAIQTGTTSGDTLLIQAYDTDGASYTSKLTLTAGTTPSIVIDAGTAVGTETGLQFNQTWNTSGVAYGLKLVITDTASGSSKLLQILTGTAGTTEAFSVDKMTSGVAAIAKIGGTTSGTSGALYLGFAGTRITGGSTVSGAVTVSGTSASGVSALRFSTDNTNAGIALAGGTANIGASGPFSLTVRSGSHSTTFNDHATAGSATVALRHLFGFDTAPTLTATNSSVTYTNAATVYIAGAPSASTNVTITNTPLALWVDAGKVLFDGDLFVGGTYYSGTTAGVDCTDATQVDSVKGLVTSCTVPEPELRVETLRAEIDQLKAQVAALLAAQRQ